MLNHSRLAAGGEVSALQDGGHRRFNCISYRVPPLHWRLGAIIPNITGNTAVFND